MTRTSLTALILAGLLVAALAAACGDDDDGDGNGGDPVAVTVMLDWTPNTNHAGIYVAQAQGWYEEAGLDVDIVEPGSGGVEQVVAAGRAEFGISVQESVIPAREQDIGVVSIAAIIEHNTSSLVALAEDGIERPRDLEGKTYGGFGGALETALIRTLVECDGGDPDAVTFAEIGNVDYLVGMERDQYDFVWIFDGWDLIRYRDILGEDVTTLAFVDYTECIPDWYTPVIITSEGMIEDAPDTVRAFMEATARGYVYAMENPDEAATILLDAAAELDEDLVRRSAEYLATQYAEDPGAWGEQDEAIWITFEAFLRDAGLTSEAVDVSEAYTNDFLPAE